MELMSDAYRYLFKNMMTADQFVLFERAISVIDSCKTHYQLITAIRYSRLASDMAGIDWCIDSVISTKCNLLKGGS